MTTEDSVQAPSVLAPTNSVQMRCEKCGRARKAFRTCATEYSEKTSIHGVKYLGQGDRPLWEKIFWIVIFVVSLYYCISMILSVWFKWIDTPFLVSFNERETRIFKIPFPAITICPQTKTDSNIFRYDEAVVRYLRGGTVTDREKQYLAALGQVCGDLDNATDLPVDIDIVDTLNAVALKPLMLCMWKGQGVDCDEIFREVVTADGICFTFNGMDPDEIYREGSIPRSLKEHTSQRSTWNRYTGYDPKRLHDAYPRHAFIGRNALNVILVQHSYQKDTSCKLSAGYIVSLRSPDDAPQTEEDFFMIPWGKKVIASIRPGMLMTPLSLKSYSAEKRQCYFDDERYLQHFKLYTQNSCNLECLANFTLNSCGCVHFPMPRVNSTPICNITQFECIQKALSALSLSEFQRKVSGQKEDPEGCNCLATCTHLEYDAETFETPYALEKAFKEILLRKAAIDVQGNYTTSGVQFVFDDDRFLASKRTELYGIADLLSNWGGLLGLFMGISVLSFVEIFYFSTIRVFSDHLVKKKQTCPHNYELSDLSKTAVNEL